MAPEDIDREDEHTTRATRQSTHQTKRLEGLDNDYNKPIRENWRSSRTARRVRKPRALPSSREELALWLQHGGWLKALIIIGVAAIVMFGIILIRPRQPLQTSLPTADTGVGIGAEFPTLQDTTATAASILATEPTTNTTTTGVKFRVFNTGDQGVFLRSDPNINNQPVKTLPDGTLVTIIGEDSVQPDHVWKHVRDPDGSEGWVAADFLQAVQ